MIKRKSCKEYRNTEWSIELDPEDWEIVNTSKDGGSTHYGVKLWSGAGYMLTPYSVWADSMEDALTLVGEWCEKHAPGMIITADRVFEEIEDGMVEIIKKDPEKYGFTEDEVESESNKKLISSLQKRDRDLYWNLREQSEQENYIDEWAYPTENPDIYLWAENLWIDKWPKDYPSLEDENDEARNMEDESKTYRKEASVLGSADDHVAWNIALVAQHNKPYATQIWDLIQSLLKKDARGQEIEADKLLKSSVLDSLVRNIIRELQRDDEDGDYRNVSTATKKLAKEYITDSIMSRFNDEKSFIKK